MQTVYKISNINGRFDHAYGMAAAIALANAIEGTRGLTAAILCKEYGWRITRCTAAQARAVGMASHG